MIIIIMVTFLLKFEVAHYFHPFVKDTVLSAVPIERIGHVLIGYNN